MSPERVIVYIDGFNFYHGLRDAGLHTSRWLDFTALSRALLKPWQNLVEVRYFTTRIRNHRGTEARQGVYLDALGQDSMMSIDYGHFLEKNMTCKKCGGTWRKAEEKKTDVNIAVRLLDDAFDDRYDAAILISGDSDLAPPITSVHTRFPNKRVIVAFPPKRHSAELDRCARVALRIPSAKIRQSRLPQEIITSSGVRLVAPPGWLPPTPP